MAASRSVLLAFATLFLLAVPASAQHLENQPENKNAPPFDWQKIIDVNKVPLPEASGQPITDSDRTWAYVVAVGGFLLVFVMTRLAVRILAYLLIGLLVIGGIGLLCVLIDERRITTWPMLFVTTASIAGSFGVVSAVIGLFTIDQDKD